MNRFLFPLLSLFALCFCFAPAFAAAPGDLAASHTQEIAAPAAPDIVTGDNGASVTSAVQAAAPFLPGKTGVLVALFAPLIGLFTNVFLRWRKNSKNGDEDRRRKLLKDLSFAGITFASELFAQGDSQAQTGDGRYNIAMGYVQRNAGSTVFRDSEIDDQIHALLAQIPGVGATGTNYIPKPATV